jgi:hypothetical protein
MNKHPYLRAYLAGIAIPTAFLLVATTGYIIIRYVYNLPVLAAISLPVCSASPSPPTFSPLLPSRYPSPSSSIISSGSISSASSTPNSVSFELNKDRCWLISAPNGNDIQLWRSAARRHRC